MFATFEKKKNIYTRNITEDYLISYEHEAAYMNTNP
jgi:hypothetical protein